MRNVNVHLVNFFVRCACTFMLMAQFGTVIVLPEHIVKVRFNICEQVISS